MNKYELVERYEALGNEDDFLAARRLFEQDMTRQSGALDHRQYGYLLECHGRRALRRAADQYERAMSLDPDQEKVQYQWMHAKAALGEADEAITRYRRRVANSPGGVRELRLLSGACLAARAWDAASNVIDAGLALAPGDSKLTSDRGDVRAARGDAEGALADWRRAHELDPEDFGPVYSSAFLLEDKGRRAEAGRGGPRRGATSWSMPTRAAGN